MKYSPKEIKKSLEENAFYFKKKYGQNFIIDENIIDSIIKKSKVDQDSLVIEIGPGAGSLTYKLAQVAKQVLCYEVDHSLEEILNANLNQFDNIDIIYQDFLTADVSNDIKKYDYKKLYVIANLPYYITTPIIVKLIEDCIPIDHIVIMVQKEVGDRMKAEPGSKDYGSLSIYLNYYFHTRKMLDVSRNVFLPKPNVDSIVVEFSKREERYQLNDEKVFFQLVRDSFQQKRKTLRNNLKQYPLETLEKVLLHHGFDLNVRAEQLPIEIFVDIANALVEIERQ